MKLIARVRVSVDVPFDQDVPELAADGANADQVEKARAQAAKHAAKEIAADVDHALAELGDVVDLYVEEVREQ